MKILRAYKTELKPNHRQITQLRKHAGSARWEVKEKLSLSDRIFECESCGKEIDRDLNAAINLKQLAASSAVIACGLVGQ